MCNVTDKANFNVEEKSDAGQTLKMICFIIDIIPTLCICKLKCHI